MKNNQQQILSEIKSLMTSIKTQLEELEVKIAEYEQCSDIQEVEEALPVEEVAETVVEETFDEVLVEPVETEPVEEVEDEVMDIELEQSDDLPFYDVLPVPEPEIEPEPEMEVEVESEPEVEQEIEDLPVDDDLPEEDSPLAVEVEVAPAPVPVIDAMIAKQPWRTDMPGSPVRDIRSAISLNDRILFINYLFEEDPLAFQEMLSKLNAMSSFDEAAAYAIAEHSEWDLESDTVYRFMMALRRRHQ